MLAFDDLDEICNELSERIKENGIELTEESDNVSISIPLKNSKTKEIQFTLNEKTNNEKENIHELIQLIGKLSNENELLKQEMKEIKIEYKKEITQIKSEYEKEIAENKKEIDNLKKLTNNSNNEMNQLKEQLKTLLDDKNYNESKKKIEINSLIINNNKNYQKAIKKWIDKDNAIKAELLIKFC